MSDRTTSRWGRRRPWMVLGLLGGSSGIAVVALAPNILVVLVGWCVAQVFFNALLAAEVAVLEHANQGCLVDHRAAADVDQKRTRLHAAELLLADQPVCFGHQRRVQR